MPSRDRHHHVLEERVHETVPEDVDKTDQLALHPRHHPAQAVPTAEFDPVPFGLVVEPGLERFGM